MTWEYEDVDRIDNRIGHVTGDVGLACLECSRNHNETGILAIM